MKGPHKRNEPNSIGTCLVSFAAVVTALLITASTSTARIVLVNTETPENKEDRERMVSDVQRQKLLRDLQEKTGLLSIRFGASGELLYDKSDIPVTGSKTLRRAITGAVDDQRNTFQIGDYSGERNIQFAETDCGTQDLNTGNVTYRIRMDFADFKNARSYSPDEVMQAYSLGLTLFHEIDHKVSYDPDDPIPPSGIRPDISDGDIRGVIENTNNIRRELYLMLRRPGQHRGRPYKGVISSFRRTYQIGFIDDRGVTKNLRWKI